MLRNNKGPIAFHEAGIYYFSVASGQNLRTGRAGNINPGMKFNVTGIKWVSSHSESGCSLRDAGRRQGIHETGSEEKGSLEI